VEVLVRHNTGVDKTVSPVFYRPISSVSAGAEKKAGEKTREKTGAKLLDLIRANPEITVAELADAVGLTSKGVEWHVRRMKYEGRLRRVGPDKGGHWEVTDR
jgi:ATP-dependent DNA helicase RecG